MNIFIKHVASALASKYTTEALRWMIVSWSAAIIVAALFIDNAAVLAVILAYEVLP